MATIRVVLAEDNALLREGISRIIDGEPDFELVGRAADLPELLELIEDASPHVVVTDIRMPPTGTDEGIQAASWLREHKPEVGRRGPQPVQDALVRAGAARDGIRRARATC